MRKLIIRIVATIKGLILVIRPHFMLGWLRRPLLTASNMLSLSRWIARQDNKTILNDFFTFKRDYSKRYQLYQYIVDILHLKKEAVDFFEFGVSGGYSFRWWMNTCINSENRFYGFDTFEGLPEKWGTFNKGDMAAKIPETDDPRAVFIKGLFQDTVSNFFETHDLDPRKRRIFHLDADLFSSTLFALTGIYPYMRNGDLLFFDEFNVPDHEFLAFRIFCESWQFNPKLLGAVNNYLQTAFIIE